MDIESAITEGVKILKDKCILTAKLDTEILMAKAINKDRKYVLLNFNKKINKEKLDIFERLIKERSYKLPIAYLTKKKFFWKSNFHINHGTLIPRPETEMIVENALNLTKNKNKLNILDIGIGSGCILLSILSERKNFYGTGIDLSKNCLNLSKINYLKVSPRLKLFKTDVDKLGKYDLIVSNPPYNKLNIKYLDEDKQI